MNDVTKKEPTRKQHFVPQEHLRGFSQDKVSIYEYNLKKDEAIDRAVPIESVCREKDLYEIRDENGTIVNINYLEDVLCEYEGHFAEHKRIILRKAIFKENYRTKCFLTKEEKQFWTFYTALQVVRIPIILKGTAEILQESFPGQFSDVDAANIAREFCLPFFKAPDKKEINSLWAFVQLLAPKIITVCYAENDRLFTSDAAVYGYSPKEMLFDFETLWFPISSCVTLFFSDPEKYDRSLNNRLIPLPNKTVDELNRGIAGIAHEMVFSKYPFSEKDKCIIKEARRLAAEKTPKYDIIKNMGEL